MNLTVVSHPLIGDRLARLRHRDTKPEAFRRAMHELSMAIGCEAMRLLEVKDAEVPTPLAPAKARVLARRVAIVPVLRAGLGMAEGMLRLLPEAEVGHIGLARDEATHRPTRYFCNLPPNLADCEVLLADPMLATGHSAVEAASQLVAAGAVKIVLVSVLAAPEGLRVFGAAHPAIPVFTAAVDDGLTATAFITPGLGDAGDRYFGTGF